MTRVYAEKIIGEDGSLTPRNIVVSNKEREVDFPAVMPLPRWEPTWVVIDAIDRTLDYGDSREHDSGASGWRNEPSGVNLNHIAAHVTMAMDLWAFSNDATPEYVEHVEHALTRLAMELANIRTRGLTREAAHPIGSDRGPQESA